MIYLKVKLTDKSLKSSKEKSFLGKLLAFILPNANPDFEDKFVLISKWLLEFEDTELPPIREIGIDNQNQVIAKMPFKNNSGYWIDNDLTFKDFKSSFETNIITKELFEEMWALLD